MDANDAQQQCEEVFHGKFLLAAMQSDMRLPAILVLSHAGAILTMPPNNRVLVMATTAWWLMASLCLAQQSPAPKCDTTLLPPKNLKSVLQTDALSNGARGAEKNDWALLKQGVGMYQGMINVMEAATTWKLREGRISKLAIRRLGK